ncbi:MAG: response regulator transcription factor [Bacteroidia bacterium]|nr:response regulator transcription factor [Bacteroidia bacterium]
MKSKIFVIDDDEKLNGLLQDYLSNFGYQVTTFTNPRLGLDKINKELPDLVILDVMMPEIDGFTVCKELRKELSVPIILLTARGDVTDRIVGLELGADDYLPKPFEPRELVARIQTILRRSSQAKVSQEVLRLDRLEVYPEKQIIKLDGKNLDLSTLEFEALYLLIRKRGNVLSRDNIMDSLHGVDWSAFDRSIDILISRLRQKLSDDPKKPVFIKTIWGSGYKFIGNEE